MNYLIIYVKMLSVYIIVAQDLETVLEDYVHQAYMSLKSLKINYIVSDLCRIIRWHEAVALISISGEIDDSMTSRL